MPYCPICEKCLYLNGRKGSENRKFQLGSNLRKHKALRASGVSGGGGGGRGSRVGPGATTGTCNEVVSTKCGHLYHQSCLNEYITNYRTKGDIYGTTYNVLCPLCGANLSNGKMLRIDLEAHFGILEEFFTDLCKLKYMNKELKRTLELEWVDISELEKKISETKSEYEHVKGIKRNNEHKCKTTEDRIAKAIEDASTCYRYREIEKQLIDENINLEAVARRMETIISSRICTTYSTSKKQPTTSSETETVEENMSNNNIRINVNESHTNNNNNNNNNNSSSNNDILCHTSSININNRNNFSDNNNNNNPAAHDEEADHDHNRNNNNNHESCENLPVASSTPPLHQYQHPREHHLQQPIEHEDEEHHHQPNNNTHSMSLQLKQPPSITQTQNYEKFINAAVEQRARYNHQLSSGESYESIQEMNKNSHGHSDPGHDHDSDFYTQNRNKGSTRESKIGQDQNPNQNQSQGRPHNMTARGQVDISVQISVHSAWSLNSVGQVESETVLMKKRFAQEQRLTLCSRTGSNLSINSSHMNLLENLQNQNALLREQQPSDLQIMGKDNNNNNSNSLILAEKYSSDGDNTSCFDIGVQKILSSIQLSTSHFNNNSNNYNSNNQEKNQNDSAREIISSDNNTNNLKNNFRNKPNLIPLEYPCVCESEWRIEEKDSITSEFSPCNNNNNYNNNNTLSEMEESRHKMIKNDPPQKRHEAFEANLMINVDKSKSYTVQTYQHSSSSSLIYPHEKLEKVAEDQTVMLHYESEKKNPNNNNAKFQQDKKKEQDKSSFQLIPVDKSRSYTIQTFDHSNTIYHDEVGGNDDHDNCWHPQEITSSESIDPLLRSLLYPAPTFNQNQRKRNCEKRRLTRNHNDLLRRDKPIILPPPTNYKNSDNSNHMNTIVPHHHNVMNKYQQDLNSNNLPNRKLATTAVVENSVILGKFSMCFVPSSQEDDDNNNNINPEEKGKHDLLEEKESEIITEKNHIHNNKHQSNFLSENSLKFPKRTNNDDNNYNNVENHAENTKDNNNNNKPRSKLITRKLKTLSLRRHYEYQTNDKNIEPGERSINNNNNNKYADNTLKQFVITPPHMFSSGKTLQLSSSSKKNQNKDNEDQQSSCMDLSLSFPPLPSIPNPIQKASEITTLNDNEVQRASETCNLKGENHLSSPSHEQTVDTNIENEKQPELPTFDWVLPPPPSNFAMVEIVPPPPPMSPSPRHRHCHQHTLDSMMGLNRTGEENGNGKTSFPSETPESTMKLLESLLLKSPPSSPLPRQTVTNNNNSNSGVSIIQPELMKKNVVNNSHSTSIIAPPDLFIESDDQDEDDQLLHSLIENNNNNNNNDHHHETFLRKNEKDVENPFMKNSGGGDVFGGGGEDQNHNVMSINNLSINTNNINRNHIMPHHQHQHHVTPEENQIKYVITTTTTTSHHHHHHQATSTQTLKSTPSKPDYVCLAAERFVQDTCLQTSLTQQSSQSVNVGVEPADDLRNHQPQLHHHQHHVHDHQPHPHLRQNNIHHPYNNTGVVSTGIGIGIGITKNDQGQHQREQQHINRQQYNHNHNRHHYMCVLSPSEYYNNDHGYSLSNTPSRYWSFENANTNTNTVTTPIVVEHEHERILSNHFLNNRGNVESLQKTTTQVEDGYCSSSSNHHHPNQDGEDINNSLRPRPAYFSPTPLPSSYALFHGRRKSSHVNISNAFNSRVSLPFLEHDQQQCLNHNSPIRNNINITANPSISSHDVNNIPCRTNDSNHNNYYHNHSYNFQNNNNNIETRRNLS